VGIWCDFAYPEKKGDLLNLWSEVRKIRLSEALSEARKYLGLSPHRFENHRTKKFN